MFLPLSRRAFLAGLTALPAAARPAGIAFESLLKEMLDRDGLARFPAPPYTSKQASSYDRNSVAPDQPGWFANNDQAQFIRSESRNGRTEWVMLDAAGPGAIVRIWMGAPKPTEGPLGKLRVYLDGSPEPVIEEVADKLLSGKSFVPSPLSAIRCIGRNFYLPVPYAQRCVVTYDRNHSVSKKNEDRAWYHVGYRTYPAGTPVSSFSMQDFRKSRRLLERVRQSLLVPPGLKGKIKTLTPDNALEARVAGPAALREFTVRVKAADIARAWRSTILTLEFDGAETAWCPVGDFFGSGVGLNPYRDWWKTVARDGAMTSRWVMPFRESCVIRLKNLGKEPVDASIGPVRYGPWKWDDRSMYFHSNWRHEYPIQTKKQDGTTDWNYIDIQGQGVYVGDTLAIHNGAKEWWGEGDEKIWVDGENFPSHFGTGTEDYYGYSYGDRGTFFEAPFHAEPRSGGNKQPGHTTNTRTRSLDAIPFTRSLRFDMEIWHWAQTTMEYAAATYWYARPGATCNRKPQPEEAGRPILD